MVIEQDKQISLKLPSGLVDKAKDLADPNKSSLYQDPKFEYARVNKSLVYRLALAIGLEQLEQQYMGKGLNRRKSDQSAPTASSQPDPRQVDLVDRVERSTAPPAKPSSPTGATMTGQQLSDLLDRLKLEYGISNKDFGQAVKPKPLSSPNLSTEKKRPTLSPAMTARIRAAVLVKVPGFKFDGSE